MEDVLRGIDCLQNTLSNISLESNIITTKLNEQAIGIRVSDSKSFSSNLHIRLNQVSSFGNHGILTENNSDGEIFRNFVSLRGTMTGVSKGRFAYRANNCLKQIIDCNTFGGQYMHYTSKNTWSAYFSFSTSETVSCNTTYNTKSAMHFLADCNMASIYGNSIGNHRNGIVLGAVISNNVVVGGVIGPQTLPVNNNTPGNKYYGYNLVGDFWDAATLSINSDGGNYDFWVNSGIYQPLTNNVINTGLGATPFIPFIPSGFDPFECPGECVDDPNDPQEFIADEMEVILNSIPTFANVDELTKWLMEKGLYERIKEHPELLDSSIILENYIDSTQYNNKGKFGDVSLALNYIYNESNGSLTPNLIQSRIIDAETKNSNINPQSIFESNQKYVNSIILASVCRGRSILATNEISSLQMIAAQCPYTGGPSVFEARSLLLLTNSELFWEDDILCTGSSARMASKNPKYLFARVYPNPASTSISLQYDLTSYSEARFEIIDTEGRKLKNQALDTKDYSIEIELNDLVNGIYFLKLYSEAQIVRVEKFTIIK